MNRLEMPSPAKARTVMEQLYKDLERRVASNLVGICPIDMSRAFLELCHAQSCGKCTPCRVGLGNLKDMLQKVLDGQADMDMIDQIRDTAAAIMETADCAIGYEAAEVIYNGVETFRDDYEEHIRNGRCTCEYGQPVPCVAYCPAGVDIPGYIALVREERYADAIRLIRKDNPFPTTCGFICEHPCETKCRRRIVDDAVNIRGLKRMAADYAGEVEPPSCAPSTGKRIAIIGGGPCGLSTAYYLQLMGHQTTVYEMLPKLGGMLRYGIPNYRLPKDRLDQDIAAILKTGVEVICNTRIGEDITMDDLRKQYDAVLITIGASTDKKLEVEGEDAEGVISAVKLLRGVGLGTPVDLTGQEVVVVGGGNVSMDAVRTAVRLGAQKVSIVYRRRVADMTALPAEIEGAMAEGVQMRTLMAPVKVAVNEEGKAYGLWARPQMISTIKGGRASVKPTGEEDVLIPCQTVIVAIGQDIEYQHFEAAGAPVSRGRFQADKTAAVKGMPGVFTAGDCSSGPATVIKAVGAAKVAAASIDTYLGYHHPISCDVEIPIPNIDDRTPCGRVNINEREACERRCDFDGVEIPMTKKECSQEAGRCLRCDHFGYGAFKGGRTNVW
ncbi:MAG: FAD-dependent oxidoreductase [Lachnospiraceae bacterium]|nr:FAD-dependent oxidoreductase [Lachnospiraceae bacterium]